jgi:hypothetical protein
VTDFPPAAMQFILQHIESVAQLEVLIYVRDHGDHAVTPVELANTLALTSEMSSAILADLARRGFAVKADAGFRYETATSEIDDVVELLAEYYRTHRIAITSAIYSKPIHKVKTFADAFRLRPEE